MASGVCNSAARAVWLWAGIIGSPQAASAEPDKGEAGEAELHQVGTLQSTNPPHRGESKVSSPKGGVAARRTMSLRSALRVVLHQVQSPDNLGAVARAMANFEVTELWLSAPETQDFAEAGKLGVRAGHVLDALQVVPSLREAVAPCVYVLGTSSRRALERRAAVEPENGRGAAPGCGGARASGAGAGGRAPRAFRRGALACVRTSSSSPRAPSSRP